MPRGGYRPGAGRKPSAATLAKRAAQAAAAIAIAPEGVKKDGAPESWPFGTVAQSQDSPPPPAEMSEAKTVFSTPMEYWQHVLADPNASKSEKHSAAYSLAPYVHPRPAPEGKKEAKEKAAKSASAGRFAKPAAPKLVVSNG